MTGKKIFQALFLIMLPLAAWAVHPTEGEGVAIWDKPYNWAHPDEATFRPDELAFTDKAYPHFKNDGIYFMAYFNGGWILMSSCFGWEYGPLAGYGAYALISEPNGARYWAKHKMGSDVIVKKPGKLYLRGDKVLIEGEGMEYRLRYDFDNFYCDLTFRNVLRPWKPGTGWAFLTPGRDVFNHYLVNSPWADVTGTMKVAGKTIDVKGQGYSDRSLSALPLTRQHTYLYAWRTFSPEGTPRKDRWFCNLLESVSHKKFGSKRIPILLLAHGQEWALTTMNYKLVPAKWVKTPDVPYEYPTRIKIFSNDRGYRFRGEFVCKELFDFTDIFSELPEWLRKVAEKFLERPVFFRSRGNFEGVITYPDGHMESFRLAGAVEYMVVK